MKFLVVPAVMHPTQGSFFGEVLKLWGVIGHEDFDNGLAGLCMVAANGCRFKKARGLQSAVVVGFKQLRELFF